MDSEENDNECGGPDDVAVASRDLEHNPDPTLPPATVGERGTPVVSPGKLPLSG